MLEKAVLYIQALEKAVPYIQSWDVVEDVPVIAKARGSGGGRWLGNARCICRKCVGDISGIGSIEDHSIIWTACGRKQGNGCHGGRTGRRPRHLLAVH